MLLNAVAVGRGSASGPIVATKVRRDERAGASRVEGAHARGPRLVVKRSREADSFTLLTARFELAMTDLAPITVDTYMFHLKRFGDYLKGIGHACDIERISRADVQSYIAHMVQDGRKFSFVRLAFATLRRFFHWVAEEPEIPDGWRNPTDRVKTPRVVVEPPEVLDLDQLHALSVACEGKRFEDLRDRAMVHVLFDAGLRRGELECMTVTDAQEACRPGRGQGRMAVTGKTGTREVDLSKKTLTMLSRYLAVRTRPERSHAKVYDTRNRALGEALWIGKRGALQGDTIRRLLKARAKAAGIEKWWTHLMRHTSVHWQLESGARENHLARLMGWTTPAMLERYARRQAVERALEEHRNLAIGDLI